MAWVRIDDNVPRNHKIVKAGPAAAWLWVCGLAHCQSHLTDGFISRDLVPMLGVQKGFGPLVSRLVEVGLWKEAGEGYQVNDYLEFNESREQAQARRTSLSAKRAASGRAGGLASGKSRSAEANPKQVAEANAEAKRSPDQSLPIPTHPNRTEARAESTTSDPLTDLLDGYRAGWKTLYGFESSLMLSPIEHMKLEQQVEALNGRDLTAALQAYFATDDAFVRRQRHPLALFVKDPMRYLAGLATVATKPRGCKHVPPCADEVEHTGKDMAERRRVTA